MGTTPGLPRPSVDRRLPAPNALQLVEGPVRRQRGREPPAGQVGHVARGRHPLPPLVCLAAREAAERAQGAATTKLTTQEKQLKTVRRPAARSFRRSGRAEPPIGTAGLSVSP